jgi:hypothetical protein
MFLKRAPVFLVTLVAAVAGFEVLAERRIAADPSDLVGVEIYDVIRRAAEPGPDVERIYVGDSVARQFFPPGGEPHSRVRFLTTNATISVAGDFFLAQEAFRHCPNARDIVIVSRPEKLQTNLDPADQQDYFSAFFHRADEIAELWRVKHDRRLAIAQTVHAALPGIMAINNLWRQSPPALTRRNPVRPRSVILVPTRVSLSPVSAHFLARLRSLAAARGGRVRIVSVPLPDTEPWADPSRIFGDDIMYLARDVFGDGVHLGPVGMKSCTGTEIARRFAAAHDLTADLPRAQSPAGDSCWRD